MEWTGIILKIFSKLNHSTISWLCYSIFFFFFWQSPPWLRDHPSLPKPPKNSQSRNRFKLSFHMIFFPVFYGFFGNNEPLGMLTTVRLRISSITLGQKDWRLCWASLLPAVPKPPSVDILQPERGQKKKNKKTTRNQREKLQNDGLRLKIGKACKGLGWIPQGSCGCLMIMGWSFHPNHSIILDPRNSGKG